MKKIFVLILMQIVFSHLSKADVYTRISDSLELVKIYNSTDGNNWVHKSGWMKDIPVPQWFGIEVDSIITAIDKILIVTKIDLQGNKLQGQLPEINLPDLKILYLSGNMISGSLPQLNLPKLNILYLSGNKFSGNIPDLDLPELEILELSGNNLSGEIPDFHLPKLKLLNLNNNQLTGSLPHFNLNELESLYINNNKLTGNFPELNCGKIKIINLSNNELNGNFPVLKFDSLITLNLERNALTGIIPDMELPDLSELKLAYNKLSGNLNDINLPKLKNLELQFNSINGSVTLTKMPMVECIRLNNNLVIDFKDITALKNLRTLKVQNNKLTFEDIEKIFKDLPELTNADFDYSNQDTLLPYTIERNDNEFTLSVIANGDSNKYQWQMNNADLIGEVNDSFTGSEIGSYKCVIKNKIACGLTLYTKIINPMKVIYALKSDSLELVRFYNLTNGSEWKRNENWLTENLILNWHGVETDTIVANGDSLIVVKSLNLGNNGLSGQLPDINLPYVENLDLFNNEFSGNIPMINLQKLKSIDLSNNLLSGSIPQIVTPLIVNLDLSNNQLDGQIPDFEFDNLEYLNLSGNKLSGEIPNFNFPLIDLLSLSNNNLCGQIPKFNFPHLTELELNDNKLTGSLPSLVLPEVRAIDLSNNLLTELCDITNLKSVEVLNVENNKLTFEDLEQNVKVKGFEYSGQDTILPLIYKRIGEKFNLSLIANGIGNKYQWQFNKNDMPKENYSELSVSGSGEYRCKVTNYSAVKLVLFSESIDPSTIGIENNLNSNETILDILPNPASDKIMITDISGKRKIINIYNTCGINYYSQFFNNVIKIQIDVSNYPNGIYFLQINDDIHKVVVWK